MTDLAQPQRHHLDPYADNLAQGIAQGDADELLTVKDLIQLIHVSAMTLEVWRKQSAGPPYVRLGPRMIRYPRGRLVTWLRSRSKQAPKAPALKPKRG